jgi:adenine/guanine phosphoribosyltransferase-like PRPP-binding protein
VQFVDVQSISDTEYTDWPDNPKGDVEVPEGPAPEAPTIWPDGDSPVHTPELPVHSKYLHKAFAYSHVYKFLSHLQQELKDVEFDSFVCTGVSGLLMAAPIALLMNKGLTVVRKAKEHGHSKELIEGAVPKRYLIIDDFVASGNTVARVLCAMQDSNVFKESECIGACFYAARPDSEYYMETLRWCNTGRVIVTLSE